jgi:DNA-binding PadR family transcriptional regulator
MADEDLLGRRGFGDFSWRMRLGRRGWLRPVVIKMLENGPMNGMQMMDRIQEVSHGWWRPSPGSIYPLFDLLAREGVIKKRRDGKYELSARYRDEVAPEDETEDIFTNMEGNVSYLEELSKSSKRSELAKYRKRIKSLVERLSVLR